MIISTFVSLNNAPLHHEQATHCRFACTDCRYVNHLPSAHFRAESLSALRNAIGEKRPQLSMPLPGVSLARTVHCSFSMDHPFSVCCVTWFITSDSRVERRPHLVPLQTRHHHGWCKQHVYIADQKKDTVEVILCKYDRQLTC